jgi:hypothetical protein
MTRNRLIWLAAIAGAAAVAMVLVYLVALPIDASWRTNRILHHVWQGVVGLAAVGGGVWTMWPRDTGSRRDVARKEAHRKVYGLLGLTVMAVGLVITSEIRLDLVTRTQLESAAQQDLATLAAALHRYEAEHPGAEPDSFEALVPAYLRPESLRYVYRNGPVAAAADENVPPSFALAKDMPGARERKIPESRILAYLRPGNAWAPLTAVIDKDGRFEVIAEDRVLRFEWQFEGK